MMERRLGRMSVRILTTIAALRQRMARMTMVGCVLVILGIGLAACGSPQAAASTIPTRAPTTMPMPTTAVVQAMPTAQNTPTIAPAATSEATPTASLTTPTSDMAATQPPDGNGPKAYIGIFKDNTVA